MKKKDPWFIEERAFAFASLVLTKHNDVVVLAHADTDMAVDLLVEVRKNGKPTLRFFGVQMVACMDLPEIQSADESALSHLPKDRLEATIPLCVFVIGVRKPEGIYRWYVEPAVADGQPVLNRAGEPEWHRLDEPGVARLVAQVNAWYEASNGVAVPKHGGRSKTKS
jgi:hypothetical protein